MRQTQRALSASVPGRKAAPARTGSPLTLHAPAPADWHYDRPAFPGDPFMDWESTPDQAGDHRQNLAEAKPLARRH